MKRLIKKGYKEIDLSSIVLTGDTLDAFASRAAEFARCLKSNTQFYTDDIVDVKFEVEHYGYDGGVTIGLWSYREETDEEYSKRQEAEAQKQIQLVERARLKAEKAAKKALKATVDKEIEYAKYLELKEKFGE